MCVCKLRRISNFQQQFSFFNINENFDAFYTQFLSTDLGKIHQSFPFEELVKTFKIKEHKKGASTHFSPKGKIGLMVLKNYTSCSDKKLIEQLNGNINFQYFCDIVIPFDSPITNYKIVSQIRCELSKTLKIREAQSVLASAWLPFMGDLDKMLVDATCYESQVRYPTNQKLLWESVVWSYKQLALHCKYLKIKLPRTKYLDWCKRYNGYARKRKKLVKERQKTTRGLLKLLYKLNAELYKIEKEHNFIQPKKYQNQRAIIKKIYQQQKQIFTTGKSVSDRIVSIGKSYLRPIVRGKEIKQVEFGAKVNKIQVDGINFIEHFEFRAFNEGTRFISSVLTTQNLTKTKLKMVGADAIYATNKNRKFATSKSIQTDFVRKGKAGKHELERKILAKAIKKERATRLEGSFGNEKEHYNLRKIKARTKQTETLWIFFGIHTANALEIGRRIQSQRLKEVA
jgi:transposase